MIIEPPLIGTAAFKGACVVALFLAVAVLAYGVMKGLRQLSDQGWCRGGGGPLLTAAALTCVLAASAHAGVVDFSAGLLRYVGERWGKEAPYRLVYWQRHVSAAQLKTTNANREIEQQFLESTNVFWNRIPYSSDQAHWGIPDYWATPVETQGSNGGDCEDYAFGKYFTLRELGIPAQKLRITYVRAFGLNVSHMVLAYYPAVDADPLILDNLTDEILPASRRTDLQPVYSFNDDDLWIAGADMQRGRSSQIRLWRELLEKMDKERQM